MRRRRATFVGQIALLLVTACSVSDEQEVAIEQQDAQQINAQLPLVQDERITSYVNDLGNAIAKKTRRANLDWRFYVVNTPDVNAFALPGGFIYVNRGLIERTQRLDQLAGALGHEIGHVVRRHAVEQMKKTTGANIGVTLLCTLTNVCESQTSRVVINVAGSALFAKYSRQDEAQADSEAVVNVINAGIDPRGMPELFQLLIRERRREPSRVEGFFASHPLEETRVRRTEQEIAQYDPRELDRLTQNDARYEAFRAALAGLAASRRVPSAPPP